MEWAAKGNGRTNGSSAATVEKVNNAKLFRFKTGNVPL